MMETLKNKVCASLLLLAGMVPVVMEGDGTALVFLGFIAVPMFFAKTNWIY